MHGGLCEELLDDRLFPLRQGLVEEPHVLEDRGSPRSGHFLPLIQQVRIYYNLRIYLFFFFYLLHQNLCLTHSIWLQ